MNINAYISVATLILIFSANAFSNQLLAVGIDNKFFYDEDKLAYGWKDNSLDEMLIYSVDGKDILLNHRLKIENSIIGPPNNIAISADKKLLAVSNAVTTKKTDTGEWSMKPSNLISLYSLENINLAPKTIEVEDMPSGLSINTESNLLMVANRKSGSVSVISLKESPRLVQTITVGNKPTTVAISPNGQFALVVLNEEHRVVVLRKSGDKFELSNEVLPVGLYPWAISISSDGNTAAITNIGKNAASDGNPDTISIIDLKSSPMRVVQHITVADAPEGVAFSPDGRYIAYSSLAGSYAVAKSEWYFSKVGKVGIIDLKAGGERIDEIEVGSFPEGIAFSNDGKTLIVGDFGSKTITQIGISRAGKLKKLKTIELTGGPASLAISE